MKAIFALNILTAALTSSSIAEPDTTLGETSWSSSELVATGAERIITAPSSTVTMTIASPCVVTWTGNGLAVDTEITYTTDGALPTGIVAGTVYYLGARLSVDTFTMVDADGRAVNATGTQSGTHTATAHVHKVYQAAVGYSQKTVSAVDNFNNAFTVTAHGFVDQQPVMFGSTGSLPTGMSAATLYYVIGSGSDWSADTFAISTTAGGSELNFTSDGSGTISVYYVSASVAPNYNKQPAINTDYWTYVSSTNRWAMFDAAVGSKSEASSSIAVSVVPGSAFDSAGFVGLENCTSIALFHRISLATVTFDAGTDKVSWTTHGLAAGTAVAFTNSGGALPTEVVSGTTYYVINPGASDFQIAATVGGAAINLTGAGTGTHTGGQVVYSSTLDGTAALPNATDIVAAANVDSATYYNGTLTATLTGTGTVKCAEMIIGEHFDMGTTVDDVATRIQNYTVFTRDAFGNVTKTIRGYSKQLRCNVLIDDNSVDPDDVADYLADHKDDDLLFVASTGRKMHSIYGAVTDWEMTSPSEDYKVLRMTIDGLTAT